MQTVRSKVSIDDGTEEARENPYIQVDPLHPVRHTGRSRLDNKRCAFFDTQC